MAGDKVSMEYVLKRMDSMEQNILSSVNTKYKELDERVDNVETFQTRVGTLAAVLSTFAGVASTWVWRKVTGES